VIDRATGAVARVINPDFEHELDGHHVGPHQFMIRASKAEWGIDSAPNSMTLGQLNHIVSVLGT
jgi:hypothetical protein